jgi:hypothetical protein
LIRARAAGAAAGCASLTLWMVCVSEAGAKAWKVQPTPNPAGATRSQLVGVSCPSRRLCLAVGYSSPQGAAYTTLAERWDGRRWRLQSGPRAAGASVLSAISCASRRSCTAVGYLAGGSAAPVPLAEHWDGERWSIQRSPAPAGATTSYLVAVSCASPRTCTAVGTTDDGTGSELGLVERWDGIRWSIEAVPAAPGAPATRLKGISCHGATACVAVGTSLDPNGNYTTLAERWDGTAWMLEPTPNPSPSFSQLVGVSCPSIGSCEAVGFFTRGTGPLRTLAERWDGSSWLVETTPNRRASRTSQIFAVACRSAEACTAAGNFANGRGAFVTLVERAKHRRWAIQPSPRPLGATNAGFDAVACSYPSRCTAVGYFTDRSGHVRTLAEQYGQ